MEDIQLGCNVLLAASVSENTKVVYRNALKCFYDFRRRYALASLWPVPVLHVATFVSYCFRQGYSPATVTTYLSSLTFVHKIRNVADPADSFIIKKILEGFRRLRSRRDIRAPITQDILLKICQVLPLICYNNYEFALFKATFCLAYYGLFRVGELVQTDQRQAGYALQLDDIKFSNDLLVVRIRVCKNNHSGKPLFLHINSVRDKSICPVNAMNKYIKLRSTVQGNLFCHASGLPLTRYQFGAILSKSVSHIGLPTAYYKSHSFRIGRATSLAIAGVSGDQIKTMGRWKSNTYCKYIRPATV